MKIKWFIPISLIMIVQLFMVNDTSAQYKYNQSRAKQNLAALKNNAECRNAIKSLEKHGLKEKETAEMMAKLAATNPTHRVRIAEIGIAQLKDRKYISSKEHAMLGTLLKDAGPTEKEYLAFKKYRDYSSPTAKSLLKFIQEEAPEYTAYGGGGRWKRIKGWIQDHIIHIIVGTVSAISGGITGGPLGAVGGFISGWKSVDKIFKNAISGGGGVGFMAQPNGAGCDGSIPAGYPFSYN